MDALLREDGRVNLFGFPGGELPGFDAVLAFILV
jgi:hypothetical protein